MRQNEDGKTVAAMDIVCPQVCKSYPSLFFLTKFSKDWRINWRQREGRTLRSVGGSYEGVEHEHGEWPTLWTFASLFTIYRRTLNGTWTSVVMVLCPTLALAWDLR